MIDLQRMLRILGMAVMTLAIAQCGDGGGGGNDNNSDEFHVAPGTFNGALSDGGAIRLEVGSIDEIAFDCDDLSIQEIFSPPRPVDNDGSFSADFTDGGRRFEVRGQFLDDDHIEGTINDQRDRCDVAFDAVRGARRTPTPTVVITPTGPRPPTMTVTTDSPTPTTTETGGTPTFTPSPNVTDPSRTPTRTPSPGPTDGCPQALEVIGTGTAKVLDTGWTGLAHNQTVIQDGKLTVSLSGCSGSPPNCGQCTVGGPLQNAKADQGDINAHRCSLDTSIKCTDDTGCTGHGKCVFYFGAPLPLSAGQVSTCVTNQISGNVSGTTNLQTGEFASTLNLSSKIFAGIETAVPCPVCIGDAAVNDGTKGGTCKEGPKNGQPCDGNGRSPVPSFGTTSFDCPPNPGAVITTLSIALDGSSGTETMTLTANSPPCSDAAGKKCFCLADGQATRPNACIDDTSVAGDGTICAADSQTEGHCSEGPVDQSCKIESFRGCTVPTQAVDCPFSGDSCETVPRPCYLDNGAVNGSVKAFGMADPPSNGEADPTFAALFCVGKTNAAVNAAAGLPGLGRIELPLHTKQIATVP